MEFRKGPGVFGPNRCIAWVELVVRFAQASLTDGPKPLLDYSADVDGLWKFLTMNVPATEQDILRPLFQSKSGSQVPQTIAPLTPAQRDLLRRKKVQAEQKNIMASKIEAL